MGMILFGAEGGGAIGFANRYGSFQSNNPERISHRRRLR